MNALRFAPLLLMCGCATTMSQRLDRVLDAAVAEHRIVGGELLVAKNGLVIYRRAFGDDDREAGRKMGQAQSYRGASLTKPLTATLALQLVEAGLLELDAPVTRWVPTFTPRQEDGSTPVITIRQLLTHTSGLCYGFLEPLDGPYHRAQVSDGLDQPGLSLEENLRRLASVPLVDVPGKAFNYSLSTDVLGAVLERASGKSLHELVATLGLPHTRFVVSRDEAIATPYRDGPHGAVRMGENEEVPFGVSAVSFAPGRVFDRASYPSGGAGIVTTVDDYWHFLERVRTDPKLAALRDDQLIDADMRTLGPGTGFTFGGAFVRDPGAAGSAAHAGTIQWGGAWGHTWFIDPVEQLTVVLLTNTAVAGMSGRVPGELERAIYGP